MSQSFIKNRLLVTLGMSWLVFAIAGIFISWISPIPSLTILIDRSYCPQNQWSQIAQNYTDIYRKHQRRQVYIQTVILFSSLGEEILSTPPIPTKVHTLATYGEVDSQREENLRSRYSKTQILSCHSTVLGTF